MSETSVTTSIDPRGVATVTLDRPDKRNAFDETTIKDLTNTFAKLSVQSDIRVMVLASSGNVFSAGADLNWMKRMANYNYDDNLNDAKLLAQMLATLNQLPFPTVARVQGYLYGGAIGLISCCDMVIAVNPARFCLSEVKIGLIPATIAPYVIDAMGQRAARRYFTSAEQFSATVAAQLGLVSEVVDPDNLDTSVNRWIEKIVANGPIAVRAAKQLVLDIVHHPIDDALILDTCKRIADIRVSTEGQQGLNAFLEKQPAPWQQSLTQGNQR